MTINPHQLIFFNDTKLVCIHTDLKVLPLRVLPKPNITCNPIQVAFYANALNFITSLYCMTHRLYSLQGMTNLLECGSFLCCFYIYSTRIPSQMFCLTRHYANSLQEYKSWACATCHMSAPDELMWLQLRQRHSPLMCRMGVFGLFRALHHVFTRKSCDTPQGPNLCCYLFFCCSDSLLSHSPTTPTIAKTISLWTHGTTKQD